MTLRVTAYMILLPSILLGQTYQQEISSIPLTLDGRQLQVPWNGGLHSVSVALPDIDGDGDLDLMLTGRNEGLLQFYRNDGEGDEGQFTFVTRSLSGVDFGDGDNRIAFDDIDFDGDLDLFVGANDGRLKYFRNDGSVTSPSFVLVTDFLDSIDIGGLSAPAFADLNADGLNDMVTGSYREGIHYYTRNDASTTEFTFVDTLRDATGTILKSGAQFHTPAFVDIDADGDLDLVTGSSANALALYNNSGSASEPQFELVDEEFLVPPRRMGYLTTAFVDIDDDLDSDLFIGSNHGFVTYYRNQGTASTPDFVLMSEKIELDFFDTGFRSSPTLIDIDGDADLDLFIGDEEGGISFLRNTGSPANPAFEWLGDLIDFGERRRLYPAWGDLDGDGDVDLVVGVARRHMLFYHNIGSPQQADLNSTVPLPNASGEIPGDRPELADLDGDGDLDLFLVDLGSYEAILRYENVGTTSAPIFAAMPDTLRDENGAAIRGSDPFFRFADLDLDDDLDLFIGMSDGAITHYENVGTPAVPSFRLASETFADIDTDGNARCMPFLADIDNDGDLDVFTGRFMGGLYFHRNVAEPVGIQEEPTQIPAVLELGPNYPNPFGSATTITYTLPRRSNVRLTVSNIMGQRVHTVIDNDLEAGAHSSVWDGRNDAGIRVADGVYFYRLEAEGSDTVGKMLFLKREK